MALQDALHAAQHLADTSGSEVTIRLESGTSSPAPDGGGSEPDVVSGDLVVRPQVPRTDAPRPVPQPPVPQPPVPAVVGRGAWTVTVTVVLEAQLARDDGAAVDRAVSALFANGPPADLHAAITRPDGTQRRVALRPLDADRPAPS